MIPRRSDGRSVGLLALAAWNLLLVAAVGFIFKLNASDPHPAHPSLHLHEVASGLVVLAVAAWWVRRQ